MSDNKQEKWKHETEWERSFSTGDSYENHYFVKGQNEMGLYETEEYLNKLEAKVEILGGLAKLADEIAPWLRLNNKGPDYNPRFSGWLARYDALNE